MGLAVQSGVENLGWTPAPSVICSFSSYEEKSLWRRRKLKAAEGPIDPTEKAKQSLMQRAKAWGENPFPPTLLASLITAQHMRPFQFMPMLFPPVLLFTSYANIQGFKTDSAGISAAWSGLYLLLAGRRRQPLMKKWGARGIVRGTTMGLCLLNMVGGGLAYTLGKREDHDE
ncbi:hypothetical protein GB937_003782 [Aspergillus fischeri]|nr:hypothetical protein GB937_003782 [Aspergillus fischeri]